MASPTLSATLALKLPALLEIVERAGATIMAIYDSGASDTRYKADGSPVTRADYAANRLIQAGLARLTPDWPVVSEEGDAEGRALEQDAFTDARAPGNEQIFWLLDPLDGTREFIARNGEFAISLALVASGQPTLGVIYGPALNEFYWGGIGLGVQRRVGGQTLAGHCRRLPAAPVILTSRNHSDNRVERWLDGCRARDLRPIVEPLGSALKLARIAAGLADAYPRFGTTMAWDTAAGQALLQGGGGGCFNRAGEPLRWGAHWRNGDFVAVADPQRWRWLWGEENSGAER